MEQYLTYANFLDLITLTGLEIILGIDNVIFIAIIVEALPKKDRLKTRVLGLSLALAMRILMLFGVSWIIQLTTPLFTIFNFNFTGRSILLLIGGLFLIIKAALEVFELFNPKANKKPKTKEQKKQTYWKCILQIIFVDLVLSFDSVITAVGMTNNIYIITIAISIAMIIMIISSGPISDFLHNYPSIKVIALAFIALVGIMLVVNSFNIEFPKAFLYLTLFFTTTVETINILLSKKHNKKLQ